jgi:putative ABC transport system substrate-binding protein
MKKLLLGISFMLNLALVGTLLYLGGGLLSKNQQRGLEQQIAGRIAVVQPATHPSMDEITQGFIQTIEKESQNFYNFTVFNANNNVMLMRAQIEEVVQQQFDLVMTIGSKATQLAKEVTQKKKSSIPVVFTAVADPVEQDIIESCENSGNQLTGVIEELRFHEQLDLLLLVKSSVKHVLLVYNPSQVGLIKEAGVIEQILTAKNIMFSKAEVFHPNEVYQKISGLMSEVDVVLVLKDHTAVSALESIVKLCCLHGSTLMASDLDSPARGAALGFGVLERQFGVQGARCALEILESKKMPAQIPCSAAHGYKLRMNAAMIEPQGLHVSDDQIKIFKVIDLI